jgi:hypothetical protein
MQSLVEKERLAPRSIFVQVQPNKMLAVTYYDYIDFEQVSDTDLDDGKSKIPSHLSKNLSTKQFVGEKECKMILYRC